MELNKIYLGDNIEILKTLPDSSVNCCITSPPYYGLRDYGTGKWVGGDPNCEHITNGISNNRNFIDKNGRGGNNPSIGGFVCKLCGAVRKDKQVGLEETPEEYIDRLVGIFREVKRVLKDEGTLWVNIGDSYNGSGGNHKSSHKNDLGFQGVLGEKCGGRGNHLNFCKEKDLIGIPWLLAFALRADGWYLRQDIIWHKPNPMPESVKDRCTKSHEYIFLLSKSSRYYFDHEAMQEPAYGYDGRKKTIHEGSPKRENINLPNGMHEQSMVRGGHERWTFKDNIPMRNKRDVWSVMPSHYKEAHFATFPEELVFPMVLAGCPKDGVVLDPFMGSGTTAVVAKKNHRNYIGCELNEEYVKMAENRINTTKKRLF